ncbi:TPA: glycosyltransferase family 2 protein [Klebsiella pneumoniae]|nr:glycosyltransferase family 2 protein [Klebsiella pneumoniae]
MKYFIAIPTYNGGELWRSTVLYIKKYAPQDAQICIIDSSSKDDTVPLAKNAGFAISTIPSVEFNHGGTRNKAILDFGSNSDIVIFLTQDAVPKAGFIEAILAAFENEQVVCAYGRQLPHDDANPIAKHARYFNYPSQSYTCGISDIPRMGLKTVFMSNSFSAYRLTAFRELGGFPSDTILCEDMYYTAKAVLAGYKVAYVHDALVAHSHNYSPLEEFKRYFDIGVFHTDEPWIRKAFGGAGGEGKKFILSEIFFLLRNNPLWIPVACINNLMKFLGYKIGQKYKNIPLSIIKKFSMHTRYWKD